MMLIRANARGSVRCTSRRRLSDPSRPIAHDFGQIWNMYACWMFG